MNYNNYFNDVGSLVWVNSKQELNNVTVAPNKQKVFFLRSDPVFFVVSANEIGMTSITTYKFEEYAETKPDDKYVTREEFKKLVDMLGGVNGEPAVSKDK